MPNVQPGREGALHRVLAVWGGGHNDSIKAELNISREEVCFSINVLDLSLLLMSLRSISKVKC